MSTDHDDIEAMLLDGAEHFLASTHSMARARSMRPGEPVDTAAMWRGMAECGWLSMLLPEALGGSGLGVGTAAALAVRLGASLLPEPFAECAVAPSVLLGACAGAPMAKALASGLGDGSARLALAWQSQPGELDAAWHATLAPHDGGWLLSGRFEGIDAEATHWLVAATCEGEPIIVAVEASAIERRRRRLADGSAVEAVVFDRSAIDPDAVLMRGPTARAALRAALADARLVLCAQLAGMAEGALKQTIAYLQQRVQFGQTLASFQVVRHRIVDLDIQRRLAFASWREARELREAHGVDSPLVTAAISAAKARCSDVALLAARASIQLHGAIGYTQEADIGLFLDAALRHASRLGNAAAHRRRFATFALQAEAAQAVTNEPSNPTAPLMAEDAFDAMSDEQFAAHLERFLHAHYPPEWRRPVVLRLRGRDEARWLRLLLEHGLRSPGLPSQHGGMGLSLTRQLIYKQVFDAYGVARVLDMGGTLLAPVLMRYGTDAQKAHYLPRILRCEDMWCQGYSEPNAGSDLASLRTSAERRGDVFVVNGQKIWTSHATSATHIFVLVRTAKLPKKQQGISFILCDMKTPGITVRPIVNLAGDDEFCEVFFDNVEVPVANLVGPLDDGWTVAKALLGTERLVNGSPVLAQQTFDYLRRMMDAAPDIREAALADDRLARVACDLNDVHALYEQLCAEAVAGRAADADYSVLKVLSTELFQRTADLVIELVNERGGVAGEQPFAGLQLDVHRLSMIARPGTIYGGTNEIQRDILARGLLGAPMPITPP
ncbi:MAG: hypothetical protein JWQ11_3036 [Rhizobacter sp.]|nr:hypothetical protein [Rhizobacter sp.]